MTRDLLLSISKKKAFSDIGGKAGNLSTLIRLGQTVPRTYVLRGEAYRRYVNNDVSVIDEICAELERKLDLSKKYAVRSSANIEDQLAHSFAGQFKTVLNVQGRDAIFQAVWGIWGTAMNPEVQKYLAKMHTGQGDLYMAVVIQEMVDAVYSGVAFSRNPATGMNEIVIEAVPGLGTALVQDGFTPERWIYQQNHFRVSPPASDISTAVIEGVVAQTRKLSRALQRDIDLEWVFDGNQLFLVQMRDISTRVQVQVYSNRMAREMLPGMLKPLIWSVNIQLMIGDKIRLLTEMLGPNQLDPQRLVRPFYYRAYFNMSMLTDVLQNLGFRAESIEMMLGMNAEDEQGSPHAGKKRGFQPGMRILRYLPRVMRFLWEKWRIAPVLERRVPELEAVLKQMSARPVEALSSAEIIAQIDDLYELSKEIAYNNVIVQVSAYFYSAILFQRLKKMGIDYTRLNMYQESADFNRYNPNYHLELLHHSFFQLEPALQEKLKQSSFSDVVNDESYNGFRKDAIDFLYSFGHLSDNGHDFSTMPWREDADRILQLVIQYQPRSKHKGEDPDNRLEFDSLAIPWYHRSILKPVFRRAARFRQLREHISFVYTYGVSQFRVYFMELARRFTQQGLLDQPEDIFYLEYADIRQMVASGGDARAICEKIATHKQEMERARDISVPLIIYGDQAPPIDATYQQKLHGTPTAPGYHTARVKVLHGLTDFSKIEPGDILVIPYSDVSWTPLFARAGGIIAESGGMLSHSSIVAREYGIPAVVSVRGAMQLCDGEWVSLDGFRGEICVHAHEPGETAQPVMDFEKEK